MWHDPLCPHLLCMQVDPDSSGTRGVLPPGWLSVCLFGCSGPLPGDGREWASSAGTGAGSFKASVGHVTPPGVGGRAATAEGGSCGPRGVLAQSPCRRVDGSLSCTAPPSEASLRLPGSPEMMKKLGSRYFVSGSGWSRLCFTSNKQKKKSLE